MTDASAAPQPITASDLRIASARCRREAVVRYSLLVAALVSVLVSILIVWSLLSEGWTFIVNVVWADTWGQLGWFPRWGDYDIPTILVPTADRHAGSRDRRRSAGPGRCCVPVRVRQREGAGLAQARA